MPKPPAGTNLKQHRGDLLFAKTFRRSSSQCDQVAWMAEPFISPLSLTMTPALSSNGDFWIDMDFQVKGHDIKSTDACSSQLLYAICPKTEKTDFPISGLKVHEDTFTSPPGLLLANHHLGSQFEKQKQQKQKTHRRKVTSSTKKWKKLPCTSSKL